MRTTAPQSGHDNELTLTVWMPDHLLREWRLLAGQVLHAGTICHSKPSLPARSGTESKSGLNPNVGSRPGGNGATAQMVRCFAIHLNGTASQHLAGPSIENGSLDGVKLTRTPCCFQAEVYIPHASITQPYSVGHRKKII